jgi:hypothetical protein
MGAIWMIAVAWITPKVGHLSSVSINQHVGDEAAYRNGEQRIHPDLESCERHSSNDF